MRGHFPGTPRYPRKQIFNETEINKKYMGKYLRIGQNLDKSEDEYYHINSIKLLYVT